MKTLKSKKAHAPKSTKAAKAPKTKMSAAKDAKPRVGDGKTAKPKFGGTSKTAKPKSGTKVTTTKGAAKAKGGMTKSSSKARETAKKFGPRADLGAPIDGFFAKQAPHLRAILETLRAAIDEAAPDATAAIKWGMPFYTIGARTMCAMAAFKTHVNLILPGPPGTYADPESLLEGDGKTGRHLKLRKVEELPLDAVRNWLSTAAARARENGKAP